MSNANKFTMTNQFVNPACLKNLIFLKEYRLVRLAAPPLNIFSTYVGTNTQGAKEKKDL
jgi:hypothetical protein